MSDLRNRVLQILKGRIESVGTESLAKPSKRMQRYQAVPGVNYKKNVKGRIDDILMDLAATEKKRYAGARKTRKAPKKKAAPKKKMPVKRGKKLASKDVMALVETLMGGMQDNSCCPVCSGSGRIVHGREEPTYMFENVATLDDPMRGQVKDERTLVDLLEEKKRKYNEELKKREGGMYGEAFKARGAGRRKKKKPEKYPLLGRKHVQNWVNFAKRYAKANGITYKEALKEAGPAWKKHKAQRYKK